MLLRSVLRITAVAFVVGLFPVKLLAQTAYGLSSPVADTASLTTAAATFGSAATVVDWDTLKSRLSSGQISLADFYQQAGLLNEGSAMVTRSGQRYFSTSPNRQYYVQRFDSGPYSGFLAHDQIGSLYLGSWYGYSMPVLSQFTVRATYGLTSPVTDTASLSSSVAVFGSSAAVVDWDTLKSQLNSGQISLSVFYQQVGLLNEGSAMVTKSGQRYYSTNPNRQYYVQRFDSGPYAGFLAHDQVGSLYLGSWYGYSMPVLATLTSATPQTDLTLSNLVVNPTSVTTRAFNGCSFSIGNNGSSGLSNGYVLVEFYLSSNATFGDGDDTKIGDVGLNVSVASGSSTSLSLSQTGLDNMVRNWPSSQASGSYYVFGRVTILDTSPVDPSSANNFSRTSGTIAYSLPIASYGISPSSASYGASGGSGSVTVTVSGGTGAWSATSNTSWLTVTSGSSGSSSGTVGYSVASNSSTSSRQGTLSIAGQTLTVTQGGAAAVSYSISPSSAPYDASGGSGSVTVTVSGGTGSWSATSNTSWLTVTSGSSGSSSGTVGYSVASNSSTSSRQGTLSIAGQTFTVTQGGSSVVSGDLRMANTSTRVQVGTGSNILITGVVLNGSGSKRYLVRAIGPALASFGVTGVLSDPMLKVFNSSGVQVASNDDWDPSLASTFSAAGAFALPSGSRDAAVVVTLTAGSYTFQVSGFNGSTGVALIEVYELP